MIKSKIGLKDYINNDNVHYKKFNKKTRFFFKFVREPEFMVNRYLLFLRKQEYYINTANGNKIKGILALLYERKKNKLGNKLGFLIGPNCCEKGLTVWHHGTIIINPEARVGHNCIFHGNNCVGNKGTHGPVPHIGNNVDIGFGAVIIGDVTIADNVKIGANAVVTRSVCEEGVTVVGIPAKII